MLFKAIGMEPRASHVLRNHFKLKSFFIPFQTRFDLHAQNQRQLEQELSSLYIVWGSNVHDLREVLDNNRHAHINFNT